jgi:prephenate dehydrogenase
MKLAKDLILDDYYKLRISSKKLQSGRYQVKFFATVNGNKDLYGYVLVEAEETLKSVISRIRRRLKELDSSLEYRHFHLFNVGQETQSSNVMIFE